MRLDELKRLLDGQARAAREEFRALERRFQDARGKAGEQALRHAEESLEAARAFEKGVESVEAPSGARRTLFLISRALRRFAEAGRALATESERFGVPDDPKLEELAHSQRRSAEELFEALERLGAQPAEAKAGRSSAATAFRAAGRAEHVRRSATRDLSREPDAVLAIKLRGLHRRFSEASASAAEAAELLAEALG